MQPVHLSPRALGSKSSTALFASASKEAGSKMLGFSIKTLELATSKTGHLPTLDRVITTIPMEGHNGEDQCMAAANACSVHPLPPSFCRQLDHSRKERFSKVSSVKNARCLHESRHRNGRARRGTREISQWPDCTLQRHQKPEPRSIKKLLVFYDACNWTLDM